MKTIPEREAVSRTAQSQRQTRPENPEKQLRSEVRELQKQAKANQTRLNNLQKLVSNVRK